MNVPEDKLEVMARAATKSGPLGEFRPVNAEDVLQILKAAL